MCLTSNQFSFRLQGKRLFFQNVFHELCLKPVTHSPQCCAFMAVKLVVARKHLIIFWAVSVIFVIYRWHITHSHLKITLFIMSRKALLWPVF